MNSTKIQSLTKYAQLLKERLTSATPEKWAHSPDSHRAYLERELRLTMVKLNDAKLAGDGKTGK